MLLPNTNIPPPSSNAWLLLSLCSCEEKLGLGADRVGGMLARLSIRRLTRLPKVDESKSDGSAIAKAKGAATPPPEPDEAPRADREAQRAAEMPHRLLQQR